MLSPRRAATLVEVLVVVALFAVLVALLLPAIQRARMAGERTTGLNQLRQINLALQAHIARDGNRLPFGDRRLYWSLFPHLDGGQAWVTQLFASLPNGAKPFPPFVSPADPSLGLHDVEFFDRCSFAFNASALKPDGRPELTAAIRDGTSATISFAEHYSYCFKPDLLPPPQPPITVGTLFRFDTEDQTANVRKASFADNAILKEDFGPRRERRKDVVPVTTGDPPVTRPSVPGKTFQVRPPLDACDPTVAQTPHPSGMLVALFDGSVRIVRPGVSEQVFWSAVTPAGGEVAPLD